MTVTDCVFCRIADGDEPAEVLKTWPDALMITPLAPVTPGHRLVLPRRHVPDAATDPVITAITARRAALVLGETEHLAVNMPSSGQSVGHLHLHLWPCRGGTACMPWGCPAPQAHHLTGGF